MRWHLAMLALTASPELLASFNKGGTFCPMYSGPQLGNLQIQMGDALSELRLCLGDDDE